jgi:hypothetical protein
LKKIFFYLMLLGTILTIVVSCTKNSDQSVTTPPPPPTPQPVSKKLQNLWKVVSVDVFVNRDFSGASYHGFDGSGTDTYNFTSDGKLYAYMFKSIDSCRYTLLPDDSTIFLYNILPNAPPIKPDTVYIRQMTDVTLVLAVRSLANEWDRIIFKR